MKSKTILTALFLTSGTIAGIQIVNNFIFHTANSKHLLDENNGEYYNWRFGKIFYNRYGSGSPLLLIHDIHASGSSTEWRKLIDNLSKTNTVYTLDLLGCGRSEKPNITYTNFLYVQLITDFIKNVIKHKTSVIASGSSGAFAVMACFQNAELFHKIVLLNPPPLKQLSKSPSKRNKTLKFFLNLPLIGTLAYNIILAKNMIEETFENEYYYDKTKVEQKDIDCFYEAAHKGGTSSRFLFSSLKSYYINLDITHALKEINNSIYFIGGDSLSCIHVTAEEYRSCNPSIETEFIKECRQLPQLEKPNVLLNTLSIFLEKEV